MLVEIAWYFPAGKDNDVFSDCVAFCNLRGDALSHEKQLGILIDKASVNVVLLPTLVGDDKIKTILNDHLKKKPLICLLADQDSVAKKIHQGMYIMGVKDRSQSDVAKELKDIIRIILSSEYASFKLEHMGKVCGIKTDEDDPACQEGKSAAVKIQKLLEGKEFSQIKDTFLPRQGKLWHEWCQTHKELFHLRGERDKCQKQERLQEIRREQREKPSSELVQMFIENLRSLKCIEKLYFLKWNEFFLDNFFKDKLSEINHKYYTKSAEVVALKKKKGKRDTSSELKKKIKELENISDELQSATVGVEHIFRELGQIYEANAPCIDIEKVHYAQYPKLAAELMIAGHPMELMDGDAAHLPLAWITGVLDEVDKLGDKRDKRVFVLSVLGIQSSGKSTMLNAMFGLQFAVRAGRCTRGAFMQLVKVSEEIQKDFKFDYVLVVDTEGLRAPELAGRDTRRHDNALATFVIGLANLTLINIYGENQSEMEDVLHIAVQAFMRMKQVKLSPSCLFVHQNVAAIEACENNKVGKRHLEEKLDEMTKLAAEEEEFDAEFFSEVIVFDVETDVKYFAQLWEGSPPMAPPNPGYSESIQELKDMILTKASQSNGMSLSEFSKTIKDLWDALLSENFVFSFKNTVEISLYRKLEEEYSKWTWALRHEMLTIEHQLHSRIENGRLDMINTSDLNKTMSKTWGKVEKTVEEYFDEDKDKDVLVRWKTEFEKKIKLFHDEQVSGAKQKLEEIIQQKKARTKTDDMTIACGNQLLQKSKELARKLKCKAKDETKLEMDETELEKEFNNLWKGWVTDLTKDVPPIKEINIQADVESILLDIGYEWPLIDSCKSEDENNWTTAFTFVKKKAKKAFQRVKNIFSSKKEANYEDHDLIRTRIANVETQTNILIKKKPVNTKGYHTGYMHEVINHVEEQMKDFESSSANALTKEFKVHILLHACTIAKECFQNAHNEFQKNNDVHSYLENEREQYYNAFKSFFKRNSSAAVLGELLCSKLKASAIQHVYDKTALDLGHEMKCSHPPFSGNRINLEKHVLTYLAEQNDFNSYMNYITDPRTEVEEFITKSVEKYITTNKDMILSIMKKHTTDISRRLSQAVHDATEKVKEQSGNTKMWLEEFSSPLQDDLRVVTTGYDHCNDIDNFDFLKEEIDNGLDSMVVDLNNLPINVVDARVTPDEVLIEQLCKCCWVQCPFCKAICTNTVEDHSPYDHSVPFHRPSGINGWHSRHTKKLSINFCTTNVASDGSFHPKPGSEETIPFKEYRKGGPKYAHWSITPDESKLKYWTWFVCTFQKKLEGYYGLKFEGSGEIPKEWRKHTRQEAIQSLENM